MNKKKYNNAKPNDTPLSVAIQTTNAPITLKKSVQEWTKTQQYNVLLIKTFESIKQLKKHNTYKSTNRIKF